MVHNKRILILVLIMSALSQAGLVLYTPAFLAIAQSLHIDASLVKITLTVYLLGFGFSQLLYGPLSDRYGRKKLLLIGMILFIVGCVWSMLAESYQVLLWSRLLQGVGAGSCITLSRAILSDCFQGLDYIKSVTYLSSGFAVGLGISPVIGGVLISYFSWQIEFGFLAGVGLLLLGVFWFYLPESHQKAKACRTPIRQFWQETLCHFYAALMNRRLIGYLLGGVAAYGVIIVYNTMGSFLFQQGLGVSSTGYGELSFLVALTYYLATVLNRTLISYFQINALLNGGIACIFFSGIWLLFSQVIWHSTNLYIIFAPLLVATFGQAIIWSISIASALKDIPAGVGTASALFSSLQMFLSALVSMVIALPTVDNQLPIGVAFIVLASISGLCFRIIAAKQPMRR